MTKKDKELLFKDLSARLPYGVKAIVQQTNCLDSVRKISEKDIYSFRTGIPLEEDYGQHDYYKVVVTDIKPYLLPLSSMTEEQMEELKELCNMYTPDDDYHPYAYKGIKVLYKHVLDDNYKFNFKIDVIDWFNKNHFDYRGLIEKGLAINATGLKIYWLWKN